MFIHFYVHNNSTATPIYLFTENKIHITLTLKIAMLIEVGQFVTYIVTLISSYFYMLTTYNYLVPGKKTCK